VSCVESTGWKKKVLLDTNLVDYSVSKWLVRSLQVLQAVVLGGVLKVSDQSFSGVEMLVAMLARGIGGI
jgi:hypothetical protein